MRTPRESITGFPLTSYTFLTYTRPSRRVNWDFGVPFYAKRRPDGRLIRC